ncbi:HAMP domain-containing sensor histidine kinase [uncultured Tenacibaculum sp.]|uniref:HAMP domain-containing sensor histidine kinase n=1 Tax=uncultured Tenacibaculum sp. TaxID=174713 RepID=UPI0026141379|nr:HAMP domain-containing sensor histidine kinase [uncultured Tenacibaculum sp.]
MNKFRSLSNGFILKLSVSFLLTILVIGVIYISVTFFLLDKFYSQTTQRLNGNLASHLIEEKFKTASPFLEDGTVNTELFDDVMHDMMAVNRAIEVYLLDENGIVLHSVVLDHSDASENVKQVDLTPVHKFIANKQEYILGDDPKNITEKKIFSAASFKHNGKIGYIYILLASHDFEQVCNSLFKSYFSRLTVTTIVITTLLSFGIGLLSIFFISKSLLVVIHYVNKFKEGHLESRIPDASTSSLSILATTFNEMADTISDNIEEIEAINNFKKELIANVSHDLRTPLTIIRGYAETLNEKEIVITEETREEFLKVIEKSTVTLANLVNQLYEYSCLDTNELQPNKTLFDIISLLQDVLGRYNMISKQKEITLEFKFTLNENRYVYADKILIERVIQNILDNALKFTPNKGFILVSVVEEKENITLRIKDSGVGIKSAEHDSIFERNYRSKTTNSENGTGLGLAIARKIISLHGSAIQIRSEGKNKGSEFIFSLPRINIIRSKD